MSNSNRDACHATNNYSQLCWEEMRLQYQRLFALFLKTVSVDENNTEKIKSLIFFPCNEITVALVNTCDCLEDSHCAVRGVRFIEAVQH